MPARRNGTLCAIAAATVGAVVLAASARAAQPVAGQAPGRPGAARAGPG